MDGGGERTLRLSFSALPLAQIDEGIKRLVEIIRDVQRQPEPVRPRRRPPCRWSRRRDRRELHTLAARGGRDVPSASRPLTPPIYQTNVYVFEDMDTVESVWESKKPGFVYGRYGTANHAMLEELVAALEGAEAGGGVRLRHGRHHRAAASGSSRAGDHLVSARDLYGSTAAFLGDEGRRLGVETDFVDATDTAGDRRGAARRDARGLRRGDLESAAAAGRRARARAPSWPPRAST